MTFYNTLNKILEKFLIFIMSFLVLDVLWQVVSRYILASPSAFTDEIAGFLLIWVSLPGAAYVAGNNEHLAIDILLQKTRKERRKILELTIFISILIFAISVMIIGGSWLVYTRFLLDVKSTGLQLPLGYVYLVVPVSGILMSYYSFYHIAKLYKKN